MIHNTKKGTGRSLTNGIERVESHAGSKLDKKIHFGVCGLRNGVGLAGRNDQKIIRENINDRLHY